MRSFTFLLSTLVFALAGSSGPVAAQTGAAAKPIATNFKVSGPSTAKVQIELYTDYECPACREFYLDTLPAVIKDYVQTGKIRLIHRDFPLPQHQYSKLAARYANAAGEIGEYDLVAHQIFQTQNEWAQNGNLDAVLARVVSPGDLQKIRQIVLSKDPQLDATVNSDVAMGDIDRLQQTPTIVIVAKGKREPIGGAVPFSILKSYLDKKLAE